MQFKLIPSLCLVPRERRESDDEEGFLPSGLSPQEVSPRKEKLAALDEPEPLTGTISYQHQQQQPQRCVDAVQNFLSCFIITQSSSAVSSKLPPKSVPTLSRLEHLRLIVIAALPYLVFLLLFAANRYLRILPTADDLPFTVLHNVSYWESYVLPWSVSKTVASVHHPCLDLLAALPYLAHYILPVVYPLYLCVLNRLDLIAEFYRLLGWSMWIHYAIWFLLPTFPPWATIDFGSTAQNLINSTSVFNLTLREGRAFARVDHMLGLSLFHGLFSGNPVPFASFPSGHVTWPTCILLTLPPGGPVVCGLYVFLLSWATMYSDHHYLLDALAAILVASSAHRLIALTRKPKPVPVANAELPLWVGCTSGRATAVL